MWLCLLICHSPFVVALLARMRAPYVDGASVGFRNVAVVSLPNNASYTNRFFFANFVVLAPELDQSSHCFMHPLFSRLDCRQVRVTSTAKLVAKFGTCAEFCRLFESSKTGRGKRGYLEIARPRPFNTSDSSYAHNTVRGRMLAFLFRY